MTAGRSPAIARYAWALLLLLPAGAPRAQDVTRITLRANPRQLSAEFSAIIGIRELRDGTVLVADSREKRLVAADLARDSVRAVGRTGSGPGEFAGLTALIALPGDSTLLPDGANGRWLLMSGSRFVGVISAPDRAYGAAGMVILGADDAGNVLARRSTRAYPAADGLTVDSSLLVRVARASGSADTVSLLRGRPMALPGAMRGQTLNPMWSSAFGVPLTAHEQGRLFRDGWIAIVRVDPYRVDWITPDGRVQRDPPLPVDPIPVDAAEKRAQMQRIAGGRAPRDPSTIAHWPATADPIVDDALLEIPDGRVLVRRRSRAGDTHTRYDVIDRRGQLAGGIALPANERIAGFGAGFVYVAVTDADGIERLRRHAWP